MSKYGDVIGSEWGILIGCWNRDSSALSVSCDPVLTRLWSRDCDNSDCLVPKIEFPLFGWILFLVIIKWRVTVIALRFLNKNRVVVFIMTLFWGAYGTRHASGMYVRFVVAFLFKHQWWAPCGPQLDCTRVVNIQMMCTVAYLGIPVLLFPGEWTFLRCLDLLWPGFESWLDIDLVVFQRCPKITWGVDFRRVRFRLCVGVHGDGVRDSVLHGAEV